MFRTLFEKKQYQPSSDRFKSLIHTLSSMTEQELEKVEKLIELVFDQKKQVVRETNVQESIFDSESIPKEESLDERIDKAKKQLKTDELEKRIEQFKQAKKPKSE